MSETIAAAGYVRVSTSMQVEEGVSLDEQERQVKKYANDERWNLVALYREEGVSGRTTVRPRYQAMLAAAKAGEFKRLICPALDRLGRSTKDTLDTLDTLEDLDVEVVFLRERIDTSTPAGRFLRTTLAAVAQMESETIAARVKDSIVARARQGRSHGGQAGYGYRFKGKRGSSDPGDGIPIIVPDEAAIVRRIYAEYVGGRSQRQIARDLEHDGIRTKRGARWSQAIVRRILANPLYKGVVHVGNQQFDGQHKKIIEPELWEEARALRESLARTKGGGRGPTPKGRHLFRHGLLRCGRCGEAMIPRTIRPRSRTGKPYEAYLCYRRVRSGPEACEQTPVPRDHVDEAVFDYFEAVALDVDATREQFAQAHHRRLLEARAQRERAERDEQQAAARLTRVRRDYQDEKIEADDWRDQRAELSAELDAATTEAAMLREREAEIEQEGSLSDADEAVLSYLTNLRSVVAGRVKEAEGLEAVRATLVSTFESFTLHHAESEAARTKLLDPDLHLVWSPYYLEPKVRPEAILQAPTIFPEDGSEAVAVKGGQNPGVEGTMVYELRRIALSMRGNTDNKDLTT